LFCSHLYREALHLKPMMLLLSDPWEV